MVNYEFPGEGKQCCGAACGGNCSCCPFGCTITAPIVLGAIALYFSWSTLLSCHYFQSKQSFAFEIGIGPWLVEDFIIFGGDKFSFDDDGDDSCVGWDNHAELDTDDLDGPLIFARIVTLPTALGGFISFFAFLFGACLPLNRPCLIVLSSLYLSFGLAMILSLASLASKWCADAEDCSLNYGGISAILAFFLWLGAGCTIFCMRKPVVGVVDLRPEQTSSPNDGMEMSHLGPRSPPTAAAAAIPVEQVVEQTLVESDGTVVKLITTTRTANDGTKKVTETREIVQPAIGKQGYVGDAGGYPTAKVITD